MPMEPAQERRIDQVCDDFEDAWQRGQRPRIDDFLQRVDIAEQPALFADLLRMEIEYRQKAGETPRLEEYGLQFPAPQVSLGGGPAGTPAVSADRNLLFGLLALHMDFVTRDQLIE